MARDERGRASKRAEAERMTPLTHLVPRESRPSSSSKPRYSAFIRVLLQYAKVYSLFEHFECLGSGFPSGSHGGCDATRCQVYSSVFGAVAPVSSPPSRHAREQRLVQPTPRMVFPPASRGMVCYTSVGRRSWGWPSTCTAAPRGTTPSRC